MLRNKQKIASSLIYFKKVFVAEKRNSNYLVTSSFSTSSKVSYNSTLKVPGSFAARKNLNKSPIKNTTRGGKTKRTKLEGNANWYDKRVNWKVNKKVKKSFNREPSVRNSELLRKLQEARASKKRTEEDKEVTSAGSFFGSNRLDHSKAPVISKPLLKWCASESSKQSAIIRSPKFEKVASETHRNLVKFVVNNLYTYNPTYKKSPKLSFQSIKKNDILAPKALVGNTSEAHCNKVALDLLKRELKEELGIPQSDSLDVETTNQLKQLIENPSIIEAEANNTPKELKELLTRYNLATETMKRSFKEFSLDTELEDFKRNKRMCLLTPSKRAEMFVKRQITIQCNGGKLDEVLELYKNRAALEMDPRLFTEEEIAQMDELKGGDFKFKIVFDSKMVSNILRVLCAIDVDVEKRASYVSEIATIIDDQRNETGVVEERVYSLILRYYCLINDIGRALDVLENMKKDDMYPRLRSYSPILVKLSENIELKNLDHSINVFKGMRDMVNYLYRDGPRGSTTKNSESSNKNTQAAIATYLPGETEFGALIKIASVYSQMEDVVKSDELSQKVNTFFSDLLVNMELDFPVLKPHLMPDLSACFSSPLAQKLGQGFGQQGLENAETGKTWSVEKDFTVSENGTCPCCSTKLKLLELQDEELQNYMHLMEEKVLVQGKDHKEVERQWNEFKAWLKVKKEEGYDCVVDGANVGYFQGAVMNYNAIDNVVDDLTKRGKKPLLILHQRHFSSSRMTANHIVRFHDKWEKSGKLFKVPYSSNDDWYWLYAAFYNTGGNTILVSNDQLRDHFLVTNHSRFFSIWRSQHMANFSVFTTPQTYETKFELIEPLEYGVNMQLTEDKTTWHFPYGEEPEGGVVDSVNVHVDNISSWIKRQYVDKDLKWMCVSYK